MRILIASQWRTFSFFLPQAVHDRNDLGEAPTAFRSSPEISTICAGQGTVVVADIHGQIHLCNPDLETYKIFTAFDNGRVTHMKFAGSKGVLVTLGEEDSSLHPILKIWNIRHDDKKTGLPRLLATGPVVYGSRAHPVSTFATTASLSLIAIGMADGTVLLLRQVDQYLKSSASSVAGIPKARVVYSAPANPITGLAFSDTPRNQLLTNTITNMPSAKSQPDPAEGKTEATVILYIVTTHQVLKYTMTPTGKVAPGAASQAVVLDELGAALGCGTTLPSGDLVLARDEAIFAYGPEGRGQSYFYEGPKSAVTTYMNYLIITSPPFAPTASSQSATVRNFVRDQRSTNPAAVADASSDISKVTVFDPENKFVAYSGAFPEGVREVFCEWGEIFILTNNSKLTRLVEKTTSEKMSLLFSKNLYLLALNLARSSGSEEKEVADIYKRYGDHLYDTGDFDGAMQQYLKTIGRVQPSYVIRKFLDGQRINNLTSYLQELHQQGEADKDITTLLLNCYAKLKDTERLDEFITTAVSSDSGQLPFDIETAIRVCRQAGYYDHAVFLAKTHYQPEEYLRIQIEDREEWLDAIEYIRSLGQEAAEENLLRYGKTLLAKSASEATEVLVDLCCGTLDRPKRKTKVELSPQKPPKDTTSRTSYLSYLALSKSLGKAVSPSPNSEKPSAPPMEPGQSRPPSAALSVNDPAGLQEAKPMPEPTKTDVPLPEIRQFFALFIHQPKDFICFLEEVAQRRWHQSIYSVQAASGQEPGSDHESSSDRKQQGGLWNTLLELYLSEAAERQSPEREVLERRVMSVLREADHNLPVDLMQALLVCTTLSFTPGILAIYEKLGMYESIVQFWMDRANAPASSKEQSQEASKQVITVLHEYGPEGNPQLYPLVLRFLTSSGSLLSRHQSDLLEILDHISAEKIMPAVAVIQVLSKSGVATVGMVKQYLLKQITSEREEIEADKSLADSYRTDIAKKEKEIQELSDPNAPRVFQVTRCSACGGSLDLPAVHFMCRHSYHQRCLADNEASCPMCAASQGVVQEIKAANDQLTGRHDLFIQELDDSEDRFDAVVSAFSRGIIRPAQD